MTNKNSINSSYWGKFVKQIKKVIKFFQKATFQQKNNCYYQKKLNLTFKIYK